MHFSDLPDHQQTAISRALAYWIDNWDWECPTLFGLELAEFREIAATWPTCLESDPCRVAIAIQGAFRELLLGASTPAPDSLLGHIGLSFAEADSLFNAIQPRLAAAMRQ